MPGADPLGPVVITARDIYDAVVSTRDQVGRMADQVAALAGDVSDHETRLRSLEDVRPGPRLADLAADVRDLKARQWPLQAAGLLLSGAAFLFALLPKLIT